MTKLSKLTSSLLAVALILSAWATWMVLQRFDLSVPNSEQVMRSAGLVLSDIEISGLVRTTRGAVIAEIDADRGTPLMQLDLPNLRDRLQALPWVKAVDIRREIPSRLVISVVERVPFALWQHDRRINLIDQDGTAIEGVDLTPFSDLLLVVGDKANQNASAFHSHISRSPDIASRITSLVRVSGRRWDIVFASGQRLKLPADDVAYGEREAWQRFLRLEKEHRITERAVEVIDLRLADRLVLRLTEEGYEAVKEMRERT